MNAAGWMQMAVYVAVLLLLAKPLGAYMGAVYEGRATRAQRVAGGIERVLYRAAGVDPGRGMTWVEYALALLWFNLLGALAVYGMQRLQGMLPLNPQDFAGVSPDSAFNTAASFASNTNWQGYGGESTMSYLTQMAALGVQNFASAATGMAVLVALIRGLTRRQVDDIGNVWFDLVRSIVYILLPLSLLLAVALASQGVVQTFDRYTAVALIEPTTYDALAKDAAGAPVVDAQGKPATERVTVAEQVVPLGPAASQIAIKQLGTNGGGFFNVNSAHPFENPTPLSNFLELLAILLIPAGLCYTFGRMVGDMRQGRALLAAMTVVFVALASVTYWLEGAGNPSLAQAGIDAIATAVNPGGNMEGKEVRFGIAASTLWAVATTAASNGSVNAMHDSLVPLAGLVPMWLMQLGEVIFGGVGSGLYGMLVFAILAVFIAGLMVGRTPEYLGKKIGAFEIKMASVVILVPPFLVLGGTALAVMLEAGRAAVANPGGQGFAEILYAFSSAANNNGSAFGGLSANNEFYNTTLGVAMLFARYWLIVPVLALAGAFAAAKHVPASEGTLPTHTPLFVVVLLGTVLTVGALTFVPALALGPVVEHLLLHGTR